MKAIQLAVGILALVAALLAGVPDTARADVPEAPEMSGAVQDWRADPGYMVVDGVRYEFGDDFLLLSEGGQPLPKDAVRVGAQVRFWSHDGVVETVILVSDGTRQ